MLNLNYNIIGAGGYDRYSKEEAKGFIPFQIQYLIVAGGGGSAGGNNNLKAGQAGGGAQVVTGSYCVFPFETYSITVGNGGIGGLRTATFPAYTGSNGETSSFAEYIALGGNGGYIQNEVTLSFFAGSGSGADPIEGNGGAGSQWTYNLATSSFPPYPPFAHAGELISSSFYGGGGAGFMVNPPTIEYIVVGGGGGAGGGYVVGGDGAGGNGGWGGMITTGSFIAFPDEVYTMRIGSGGFGSPGPNSFGAFGTASFISGSDIVGSLFVTASGGQGGATPVGFNPVGGGSFTTQSVSSDRNGRNGYLWVDGFFYGGGGGASTSAPNGLGGLGNGADGGFPYNSPTRFGCGPWTNTSNFAGGGAGGLEPDFSPPYQPASASKGGDGVIRLRYLGSPIATGGIIQSSGSYTYHTFTSSVDFQITLDPLLIYPGLPGVGGGGVTASNATPNTGGGAGASFYFDSGSNGGSGFVAIRYEGAPIAEGGDIITTDHYTYHLYSASGEFYAIGNETNPNINPCP
jgi:hypothetical protein